MYDDGMTFIPNGAHNANKGLKMIDITRIGTMYSHALIC
jgi:hypothetical protein